MFFFEGKYNELRLEMYDFGQSASSSPVLVKMMCLNDGIRISVDRAQVTLV